MQALGFVLSRLLDVLAPRTCAACDAETNYTFCETCRSPAPCFRKLDDVPLVTAGVYEPPLSTAIVRFKYEGRAELAPPLASLLAPPLRALALPAGCVLVPVPLHRRRLATRGYNQAALLAQALAAELRLPCAPRLLLRTRETERQVGKTRELRLINAQGAFQVNEPAYARLTDSPAHVVLVDDVVTTGSTVRACAQALTAAGACVAAVVAIAYALD